MDSAARVVVGLDNGGTSINATVLEVGPANAILSAGAPETTAHDGAGRFLVDRLVETPSHVLDGPELAVKALVTALNNILRLTDTPRSAVRAVGLDTPGPASAHGVISSRGATNFSAPAWRGFDFRGALEAAVGVPVIYNNDGNAAALYAHHQRYGAEAARRSSVSAIVGTGLGGGVIESGAVVRGAAGMAGELGHIHIPMAGLLAEDQPPPRCNCGFTADVESVASLTGIQNNLLPYWLTKFPDHPLAGMEASAAAKAVRSYGERGDPMAKMIFTQQALAIGRLFTIAANFVDPDTYFVGGGVVETEAEFREWFLATIREHTTLRAEQAAVASFALVPDRDMAGARGAAIAARETLGT